MFWGVRCLGASIHAPTPRYIADESVDLVYLDPPFQSGKDYNVLFEKKDGSKASAQIMAFEDTWHWGLEAEQSYVEIVESGGVVVRTLRSSAPLAGFQAIPPIRQLQSVRTSVRRRPEHHALRGIQDRRVEERQSARPCPTGCRIDSLVRS